MCPICKKGHWVRLAKGLPRSINCHICTAKNNRYLNLVGEDNPKWKGGKWKTDKGYILIWVEPDSVFASMRKRDNHVYEHRLVMAQYLGRPLKRWEMVHHINHIRDDNRIENLQLLEKTTHPTITILETENKRLKERIRILEGMLNEYKN